MKKVLAICCCIALTFTGLQAKNPNPKKEGKKGKKTVSIAFYNLENLFDTEDDPKTNDQEFLPEGSYKWTEDDLKVKIQNLGKVINELGDEDGPEILGVCEVENKAVLERLVQTKKLRKKGYEVVHKDSPDQRGIDCALVYKKKKFLPLYTKSYAVQFPENPDIKTRDIFLVKGILDKEIEVTFIVNHWSSRRGGSAESSYKRERAATILRSVVDSIQNLDPLANIVIMGDFNDEPGDKSVHDVLRTGKDSLEARYRNLFNCMYKLKEEGQGTLKFRGKFNLFDQMIISTAMTSPKARLRYVSCSAAIYNPKWMRVDKEGDWKDAPKRTHIRREFHADGFSDHFPVYIHLEY